jgi:hypothetical protein
LKYAAKEALLDECEREEIEPILRTWRDGTGHEGRDGTLHLLHSRQEVGNWGAEKFFRYYGGEAVYWPFGPWRPDADHHWFLRNLESIGVPVVVEAKVAPSDLITGSANSGADVVISYFARSVNPCFEPWQPFCLTKKSVSPEQIMSVTPLESFVERFDLELDWGWKPQWAK